MRASLLVAALAGAGFAAGSCLAQSGQNKAVHNWNTKAFSVHPPANTRAFSVHPPANKKAFAVHPPANTNAFGTEHGGKVTAFGKGRTNAFGNSVTARHNTRRLANSFGTGNDYGAAPLGSHAPNGGNGGSR